MKALDAPGVGIRPTYTYYVQRRDNGTKVRVRNAISPRLATIIAARFWWDPDDPGVHHVDARRHGDDQVWTYDVRPADETVQDVHGDWKIHWESGVSTPLEGEFTDAVAALAAARRQAARHAITTGELDNPVAAYHEHKETDQ